MKCWYYQLQWRSNFIYLFLKFYYSFPIYLYEKLFISYLYEISRSTAELDLNDYLKKQII